MKATTRVTLLFLVFSLHTSFSQINWQQTNGPYGGAIHCFVVSGTNLFAGSTVGGVFLSTNNGTSWTAVNSGLTNLNVWSLAISGTHLFAGTNSGVFLSTDNGASWNAVNVGLTNFNVSDIAVSGTNLFAGTNGGGVFLSTNNGSSWTAVNAGLTNTDVNALAISPNGAGSTNLFAGTFGGIFLSTNNGASWNAVNAGLTNFNVRDLAVSGTSLFAGTNGGGVFLSTNNGSSWNVANAGLTYSYVDDIAVFPDGAGGVNLFAGTLGGVFLSTNSGTSWTPINTGLSSPYIYALAISGTNLFAGTQNGVSLSINNGTSWTDVNTGLICTDVLALAFSPNGVDDTTFFAGTNGDGAGGVFFSTDNGTSWTARNVGLTNTIVNAFAISGANIFAATYGGVFLSTNNGSSWTAVNTGLTNTQVNALAVCPNGAGGTNLFAGTNSGGVFLSTNNGSSWTAAKSGLPFTGVHAFAVIGANLFVGTWGGVFVSNNNGTSWSSVNTGLTSCVINALAVSGTNLFAGTNQGIFLSTNNGASWTAVNIVLSGIPVNTLAIDGTNLYAGTYNSGVLFSTDNGTSWNDVNIGLTKTNIHALAVNGKNLFAGTEGGGVFVATLPSTSPPTIASFSPTSGPIGTTVTITGTNFSPTLTDNIVYFGGVKAIVTEATSTLLRVTVPIGSTYQPITVTVNGLTAYSSAPFVVTFVGGGSITISSFAPKLDFNTGTGPYSIAIGDIDGDGKPDLVVTNQDINTVSIYRNTSISGSITVNSFAPKVDFTTGEFPYNVAIGDIDGDGKPDLVVINWNSNTVSIFRNTSVSGSITASSFASKVDFGTGGYPYNVAISDMDGDGKPDLTVTNWENNTVSVFRNTCVSGSITASSFAPKVNFATGSFAGGVAICDVDGNGKPDIIVANYNSNTISILRNTSNSGSITASSFAPRVDFITGVTPESVAAGDMDGDGKPDIIVANGSSRTISVFRNISASGSITTSSFSSKVDFAAGSHPFTVAIGDVDGDGKPDIVVTNYDNNCYVFKNTSISGSMTASSFAPKIGLTTGRLSKGIALGDVDGDGKPDLVTTNHDDNTVSVLRNTIISDNIRITTPRNLTATAGNGQVTLQWNKNIESDFTRYRIYCGTLPNPTTKVDSTTGGITDTTRIITGLTNGIIYYFRVTAVDSAGLESAYSNEISITGKNLIFTSISPVTKAALDTVKFIVNATGPTADDVLTYSVVGLPTGAKFDTTGTFFWVPTAAQYGSYKVSFLVSDGQHKDSMAVSITITMLSLIVKNSIAEMILTDAKRVVKVKLTSPPVFANNAGVLKYTAISGNANYVTAAIISLDTLKVQGLRPTPPYVSIRITINAIDTNNSTISASFFVIDQCTTDVIDIGTIPKELSLSQNYPNPFNPSTIIGFNIPTRSFVLLRVFDVTGREVATLVNQEKPAGAYQVTLDAGNLPSGTYFYRLQAGMFTETKKLLLMR